MKSKQEAKQEVKMEIKEMPLTQRLKDFFYENYFSDELVIILSDADDGYILRANNPDTNEVRFSSANYEKVLDLFKELQKIIKFRLDRANELEKVIQECADLMNLNKRGGKNEVIN